MKVGGGFNPLGVPSSARGIPAVYGAGAARFEAACILKCACCKGWVCENHPHMAWSDEFGC